MVGGVESFEAINQKMKKQGNKEEKEVGGV